MQQNPEDTPPPRPPLETPAQRKERKRKERIEASLKFIEEAKAKCMLKKKVCVSGVEKPKIPQFPLSNTKIPLISSHQIMVLSNLLLSLPLLVFLQGAKIYYL